ncbi:N-acetyltransferase [Barnesiella propionica]|uniref:GNAT family N-acetyltransferase n=1 Tax=Barnesiella propionica TaxID=2981781 RepID=UPI0011CBA464|nr:N-acetyltransferase [Barnesiella propionica]MCU6768392.1 N-acetyltransferase [Barnesiella propionica]
MNLNDIKIRETTSEDFDDIMDVERQAFGSENEATLVSRLLADKSAEPIVSLLAFHKGQAIGHIFFTRVYFNDGKEQPMMHILAPVAVKPEYQRQGLGGMLIRTGIRLLQEMGSNLVFVLGHKEYYPRYGFLPRAACLGYPAPYPISDQYADFWMVRPVSEKGFDIGRGQIRCSDVLNRPEYWGKE